VPTRGEIDQLRAQVPKLPRRVLDVLSRQDIDRLEEVAHLERDKVILRLLADTGTAHQTRALVRLRRTQRWGSPEIPSEPTSP
jgi:hypothetical protein